MTTPKTCPRCFGLGKILVNASTGLTKACPRGCPPKPKHSQNGTHKP